MSDLEALRELSEKATPGPWVVFDAERPGIDSACCGDLSPNVIYSGRFSGMDFGGVGRAADAAFIVAAVNYVRAVLAPAEPGAGLDGPTYDFGGATLLPEDHSEIAVVPDDRRSAWLTADQKAQPAPPTKESIEEAIRSRDARLAATPASEEVEK